MNVIIEELKEHLKKLDVSQSSVETTSQAFLKYGTNDETIIEDLLKLWKYYAINSTNNSNKIAFVYLANDIIHKSKAEKVGFHKLFFNHITEAFPIIFNEVHDKSKKEIQRIIDIWIDRSIYEKSLLNYLKQLLTISSVPNFESLSNPLFQDLLKCNKIKISSKILDFASNYYNFEINKERSLKIRNEIDKRNKNEDEILQESTENISEKISMQENEFKRCLTLENKYRENLLKNGIETVKSQYQSHLKNVIIFKEVEGLLEKIKRYKNKKK